MPVLRARINGQWVDINMGGSSELLVQEEGVNLAKRPTMNFVGDRLTASDDAAGNRTLVTIAPRLIRHHGAWNPATTYIDRDAVRQHQAQWYRDGAGSVTGGNGPGTDQAGWRLLGGLPQMTTTQLAAWTTAISGESVYHLDLKTMFTRYGSSWVPVGGYVYDTWFWGGQCDVGGDLSSSTIVDWGFSYLIDVPPGAREAQITHGINAAAITANFEGNIRMSILGGSPNPHNADRNIYAAAGSMGSVVSGVTQLGVTPGATLTIKSQGWRVSAGGALRASRSNWWVSIVWRNTPTT